MIAIAGHTFDEFYARSWPVLVGFAATLTRDASASAEIAQEALARTWARWPVLREPMAFAARVTRNLAVDHLRRRGREVPTDQVPDAVVAPVADPALLELVRALPPRLRDVVLLHYFVDLSVAEVATVLRRPVGTVKRRLHEARALLAVEIGDDRD